MSPLERTDARRSSTPGPAPDHGHAELGGELTDVVGSLHHAYDDRLGAAVVDSEIQEAADQFVGARIRAFVPLFVRRFAGAALRDQSAHHDPVAAPPRTG